MQADPNRLRRALDEAGISGAQLAEKLDVSKSYVSHWLTDRRVCPAKYLDPIAEILKVDRGWLVGDRKSLAGDDSRAAKEETAVNDSDSSPHVPSRDADWHFRNEPPDGGRDYGSGAVWTVPANIDSLLRETGQNSLDHAVRRGGKIHMRFSLIELTKGSRPYKDFTEAIHFDELHEHVTAAAETRSKLSTRLRGGLKRLAKAERLRLLKIEDFGATGLYGHDQKEGILDDNPFAALVRNNLDSSKQSTTAGGSFGLGKAVLWRCSSLSTVFFASDIASSKRSEEYPDGNRVAGKAELTWHQLGNNSLAGPGWLGRSGTSGASLWASNSDLEKMQLSRDPSSHPPGVEPSGASGTSILILGFQDPDAEEPREPEELLERIAKAAAVNFWPIMVKGRFEVSTRYEVDGEVQKETDTSQVNPMDYVLELCDALIRHEDDEIDDELVNPGDVVRLPVSHRIPATEDETDELQSFPDELEANAHLLVRLAKPEEMDSKQLNHVALVRGRGMVVKYWLRRNLVVGAKPFHAILLAGRFAGSEPHHIAAEQFLRIAEPPAHDDWEHTEEVKEKYVHGSGVRLDDIFTNTTKQLTKVLRPSPSGEDEGPPELKKLLQLATPTPPPPPTANLRNVKTSISDGKWDVRGDIYMNDRDSRWSVSPRLRIDAESGERVTIPWQSIEVLDASRGSANKSDGSAFLVEPGTRSVKFAATSQPEAEGVRVAECRVVLDLQVKRADKEGD